eukprot:3836501-Rhodomonas_salina.1
MTAIGVPDDTFNDDVDSTDPVDVHAAMVVFRKREGVVQVRFRQGSMGMPPSDSAEGASDRFQRGCGISGSDSGER